uniref:Uncharacterized protein n=1 Tax=Utricularia reniformis TaxID=192314 RepID=A0A1Y0AYZ6_9LAMI|nr:hypothetical protein AEK19_MT0990 [Utricularia reniformis]ART30339.1 hypothetical protein AEK19_MT0990 [Utricularia reniformis]
MLSLCLSHEWYHKMSNMRIKSRSSKYTFQYKMLIHTTHLIDSHSVKQNTMQFISGRWTFKHCQLCTTHLIFFLVHYIIFQA